MNQTLTVTSSVRTANSGEVDYDRKGAVLHLVRAEVPVEKRGQGLGVPVKGTLEAIREEGGLTITPVCPYIAKYMMKNSEFDDLRANVLAE